MRAARLEGRYGVESASAPERRTTGGGHWLTSTPRAGATGQPVPRLTGGGKVLPVFSSEEEAAEALHDDPGGGRRIEAVDAGELLSILSGPSCRGVEVVMLDPIPDVPEEVSVGLVGEDARRFARHLARRLVEEVARRWRTRATREPEPARMGRGRCSTCCGRGWTRPVMPESPF